VILLTNFPKAATKQPQTGKSDAIDILYCIYSAVKDAQFAKWFAHTETFLLRSPSTSAFGALSIRAVQK